MGVVYDELYISTMREIEVCRQSIRKLKKNLGRMEKKYHLGTAEFVERFNEGTLEHSEDYVAWHTSCEGLKRWEERLKEFYEILKRN